MTTPTTSGFDETQRSPARVRSHPHAKRSRPEIMSGDGTQDAVRAELLARVGQPMSGGGPTLAPDPVNLPMIRHWVDAFDDRNPVYLDEDAAVRAGFGGIVAPA